MTKNEFIKEIARREGKRSETSIGNIRETIKVIETIEAEAIALECESMADIKRMAASGPFQSMSDRVTKLALRLIKRKLKAKNKK